MEKDNNYIAAIDMGTSNTVILIGRRAEGGKIDIVASSVVDNERDSMWRGDIRNIDKIVLSVQRALREIEKEYSLKVQEAYLNLSGKHIKCDYKSGYVSISNSEGEVRREDVDRLSNDMRNISVPAGEVIVHIRPRIYKLDDDNISSEPIGMIGKRLSGEFNIITAEKSKIDLIYRCLNRVDVRVADVVLSSLASAEAVLVDDQKELGVVVLDFGGGTCDVCIYHDKAIRFLGVIPFGGVDINSDIRSCGVLERLVERLKVKFGCALSSEIPETQYIRLPSINNTPSNEISQKQLASIIEARLEDISDQPLNIIKSSGYEGRLAGGIVLTGGGANLNMIKEFFAQRTGMPVRIATPDLYVSSETVDKVASPLYSTAVGLLLIAASMGRTTATLVLPKPKPLDTVYDPYGGGDGDDLFRRGQDTGFDEEPGDYDDMHRGGGASHNGGFGGWFKRTIGKVRDTIDPEESLEDNDL